MDDSLRARARHATVLYVDVYAYRIEDGASRFLVLERRHDVVMPGAWQHISGKLLEDEKIKDAFVRQVRIKTGQEPLSISPLDHVTTYYDEHYDTVMLVPSAACEPASEHVAIDRDLHADYRWLSYEEAVELLRFAGQRACLALINDSLQG